MKIITNKIGIKKPKTWSRKGECPSCHVGGGSKHRGDCTLIYVRLETKPSEIFEGENSSLKKTFDEAVAHEPMISTDKIDEMVRDFCSVVPKSKSEVRQRIVKSIHQTLAEEKERILGEIEKVKFTIYDGDKKREVVGLEDLTSTLTSSLNKTSNFVYIQEKM